MPLSKKRKAEYNKRYYLENISGILKPIQIPKVRVIYQGKLVEVERPELDADGNIVPEYT